MFPSTTAHVGALGPGVSGPSYMMDHRAAELHYQANKGARGEQVHQPSSGAADFCVDPAELTQGDPADPRQRTQ